MRFALFLFLIALASRATALNQNPLVDSLRDALVAIAPNSAEAANLNLQIGLEYYRTSDSANAKAFLLESQRIATSIQDTLTWAKALNGMGRLHSDNGEHPLALAEYQRALRLATQLNDLLLTAHIQKNIGVLYISWKDFSKALSHYDQAQQLAVQLGDNKLIADCYNNKATAYEQLKEYDKALDYYQRALDYYEKEKLHGGMAMCYSNMAIVFKEQRAYQKAIDYNVQALAIIRQLGEKWMEAATLNNIGSVHYSMGHYDQTIVYCEASLQLAETISAPEIAVAALETLADGAAARKDHVQAYRYMVRFHQAHEQFINAEKTRQFSELEVKYQTEVKEQQIALLNNQNLIQQLSIDRQKTTIGIIIGLLLALTIIGLLLFSHSRLQQQARLKQQEIQLREKLSHAVIEAEENERRRVGRELHDGIGQLLSVANMNLSVLANQIAEQPPKAKAIIDKTLALMDECCTDVRQLSHQMMPDVLLQNGLPEAVRRFVEQLGSVLRVNVDVDGFEHRVDPLIETMLYRVIQEAVNNVLKHAKANRLDLQLSQDDGTITCMVEDDGIGYDTGAQPQGIGLNNMLSRVAFINGQLEVSSMPGRGTLVSISVPL